MTRPLSEVYARAAALVRGGWVRGHYKVGDCYCAIGALIEATCEDRVWGEKLRLSNDNELCRPLANYLYLLGDPKQVVARWNDETVPSGEIVAEVFESVAAELKGKGR